MAERGDVHAVAAGHFQMVWPGSAATSFPFITIFMRVVLWRGVSKRAPGPVVRHPVNGRAFPPLAAYMIRMLLNLQFL